MSRPSECRCDEVALTTGLTSNHGLNSDPVACHGHAGLWSSGVSRAAEVIACACVVRRRNVARHGLNVDLRAVESVRARVPHGIGHRRIDHAEVLIGEVIVADESAIVARIVLRIRRAVAAEDVRWIVQLIVGTVGRRSSGIAAEDLLLRLKVTRTEIRSFDARSRHAYAFVSPRVHPALPLATTTSERRPLNGLRHLTAVVETDRATQDIGHGVEQYIRANMPKDELEKERRSIIYCSRPGRHVLVVFD